MTTSRKRLGILQAGHSPDEMRGDYPDYNQLFELLFGEEAFDYCHYPVVDGVFPDSATECDAWLITGSRYGAYEDHDWIPPLENLVREIHDKRIRLVGICFGHQIIAQALGGKVEKFSGGWSVGQREYRLDPRVFGSSEPLSIMAYHQDQVVELPEGAEVIGNSDFCRYAALAYGDDILTIQPHPEFDGRFMAGLLKYRGMNLPDDIRERAENRLEIPLDSESVAETFKAYLQGGHSAATETPQDADERATDGRHG
ncbi:MAG: glutamine amidotransferase [Gammaproteobacteria bacterium]|nr:MAG: glutamine amidotransferase [Gammaproteobacteria bacterium]